MNTNNSKIVVIASAITTLIVGLCITIISSLSFLANNQTIIAPTLNSFINLTELNSEYRISDLNNKALFLNLNQGELNYTISILGLQNTKFQISLMNITTSEIQIINYTPQFIDGGINSTTGIISVPLDGRYKLDIYSNTSWDLMLSV